MKKIVTILLSFLFISYQSVKAEVGMGITAALHTFDASGSETMRESGTVKSGSNEDSVLVPELFIEAILDNGGAFGFSYIPTRQVGSESRTDTATNSGDDAATYTAEADLDNVIQVYADIPTPLSVAGNGIYVKTGIQHATLKTLESLNSGSTYPDADLMGLTLGLGTKGDLPYGANMYYKAEATYTNFESYEATSSAGQKIEADLEDIAVKLSIGYKF